MNLGASRGNLIYVYAVALSLLATACSPEKEEAVNEVRPVRVVAVEEHRAGQTIQFAGTVESQIQVDLAFRIGGRVLERSVNVGDSVEAGQRIAALDASDEENGLRAAEASFVAANGQLSEARLNYDRQRQLYRRQVVARAAVDRVEQALTSAQAAADAAQAQVGIARRRLDDTVLYADSTGVVTAVGIEPGEVTAAGRMVVQLARDDGKDAVFNIPAATIANSPPDPEVLVSLSMSPGVTAHGRVREVAPRADVSTGTFLVRVGLIDPPAEMRLGSTVTGRATFGGAEGMEIPASALTRSDGQPAVWVVDPATQKVALRTVDVVQFSPASVIVSSGIAVGDLVVTAGVQALRPGQEVRVPGAAS
ncbi:MAG: efflux RND transporter periplasmic adaptor subunit [Phyllobacterium sp.]